RADFGDGSPRRRALGDPAGAEFPSGARPIPVLPPAPRSPIVVSSSMHALTRSFGAGWSSWLLRALFSFACWLFAATLSAPAAAAPMKVAARPPELRGWVPWVLHGEGESACPLIGDAAVCLWPGALELDLDEKGGRFRQRVFADREVLVPLPGSLERWPQEVELGGKPAVVLQVEERPVVRIPAGEHELTGKFSWPWLPERLAVHPHLARVELSLSGKAVSAAHRGDDGSVWLAAHDAAGSVE